MQLYFSDTSYNIGATLLFKGAKMFIIMMMYCHVGEKTLGQSMVLLMKMSVIIISGFALRYGWTYYIITCITDDALACYELARCIVLLLILFNPSTYNYQLLLSKKYSQPTLSNHVWAKIIIRT